MIDKCYCQRPGGTRLETGGSFVANVRMFPSGATLKEMMAFVNSYLPETHDPINTDLPTSHDCRHHTRPARPVVDFNSSTQTATVRYQPPQLPPSN